MVTHCPASIVEQCFAVAVNVAKMAFGTPEIMTINYTHDIDTALEPRDHAVRFFGMYV